MLEDLKLDLVDVDGCAVGVHSKTGEPILKPWRIAVSSPLMRRALDGLKCQGGYMHVPCSGDEAARSAFYPEHLCNAIHDGLDAHESASADKCVGGGCIATLEGNIVDPVVEREQTPIDDAQQVGYSFLDEVKGSAVASKETFLILRKTLRGRSSASSKPCMS